MRVLLDTAVLIYAVESPERLSKRAATILSDAGNLLEISAVSLAEIAIKADLGKLQLSEETSRQAVQELGARVLAYNGDHAYRLFGLPAHHRDPFDRQIIAQALSENIPVITPDETFRLYKGIRALW